MLGNGGDAWGISSKVMRVSSRCRIMVVMCRY